MVGMELTRSPSQPGWPSPGAVLALLKPITWFPPMWAYACGAVATGHGLGERVGFVLLGVILAGPLLCGMSQAVNDWFDRHVDAINEPDRVIPSGRMPGAWGLYIAVAMSLLSLLAAWALGPLIFGASVVGLAFAWAYSAPPFRFKQNGWIGNGVVGFSYETLPWLTAATAMTGTLPDRTMIVVALLYGLGALGILTLNDFKAITGDKAMGIRTLPVLHGARPAAVIACVIMAGAQAGVVGVLAASALPLTALTVGGLLVLQVGCMVHFVRDPVARAVWYSAVGVGLFVSGMMVTALGLATLAGAAG
ncbi:chlorophyll synthase ChlG [Microvirga tunisiensis]|uniref:Chlorophyll synthase ChlG n=2 Tax=Pannonibacter tanglangensis TaxID=2750084 RepID=A0ABW9ZJ39_9HYPH|nr:MULTISPECIES: chlorophyll synthase ChlG [unclassified Pannonibacter]NBN63104.1 chlorophyll synthase ChlG [Pannonibacter sp. XCT-34]NBN76668.1 chlorophyll synthase ChlG [Pannonibacter sp. XCT-53]